MSHVSTHFRNSVVTSIVAGAGALALTLVPASADAGPQGNDFGIGLVGGSPSGVNFKNYLSSTTAWDLTVGLGLLDGNHLRLTADYLLHMPLGASGPVAWQLYYGVGPQVALWDGGDGKNARDGVWVGARVPVGVAAEFDSLPLDVFLEVGPGLWVVSDVHFDISGALGIRYWF